MSDLVVNFILYIIVAHGFFDIFDGAHLVFLES